MIHIDTFIVLSYLFLTLIVDIYKGRNVSSIKEYAVGNYTFSTPTLVAAITATFLGGGSIIGVTEKVYSYGTGWIVIFSGDTVAILIFTLLAPKILQRFHGCLSVGEILTQCYGLPARVIAGFCTIFLVMGEYLYRLLPWAILFSDFMQAPLLFGFIVAAGTVVLYSAFDRIKSVTYTDIIQFRFFIIVVPMVANVTLDKVGGYNILIQNLPNDYFNLIPSNLKLSEFITLLIIFSLPFLNPSIIQ